MAGSSVRIHGHRVRGDEERLKALQRMSPQSLSHLFREALEHGRTRVMLHDRPCALARQPDHTFVLEPEGEDHLVF